MIIKENQSDNSIVNFTTRFFNRLNLVTHILDITQQLPEDMDLGLRRSIIGEQRDSVLNLSFTEPDFIKKNIIYFSMDKYGCHYLFIPIPSEDNNKFMVAGPYLTELASIIHTNEICKAVGISANLYPYMHQYFSTLPCLQDTSILEAFVDTIAEDIYGSGNYSIQYLIEHPKKNTNYVSYIESSDNQDIMKRMEYRYALEKNVMNAIARGDFNSAMKYSTDQALRNIDNRSNSTLRSKKNNLLAFNTICRKGAEEGGVHPIYLDEMSRRMAIKIENMTASNQDALVHREVLKKYCSLVQHNSVEGYSPTMQRVLVYISQNLYDTELSLQSTATALSINKSYLATIFKRETKETFTKYVNGKRLERAIFLLNSTNLQIQTIASNCGIPDVTYFTRIFKAEKGMTPSQYRKLITSNDL